MDFLGRFKVMIVGTGGNGVAAAVRLLQDSIDEFVIISKHGDFGGVWYQNRYPGCALDDVIMGYQYDFAVSTDWNSTHATWDEVAGYIQKVAADYGLYEKAHFGTELLSAEWDEAEVAWRVTTNRGYYLAQYLLPVTGYLEEPILPEIPGMETFQGRIFHSSLWPEGYTGGGDHIAVVGTGSSALQIVPAMQKVAAQVTVFQRTPNHILPLNRRPYTAEEREAIRVNPDKVAADRAEFLRARDEMWRSLILAETPDQTRELERLAQSYLEEQVRDPELRAKLTPSHDIGCKRIGASDEFYAAVQQRNVELVAEAAAQIETNAIYSASGRRFEVDAIVLATGFLFGGSILHRIKRRDGRIVGEYQQGRPRAYKSVTVSGCPNLFLIGGAAPNGTTWRGIGAGTVVTGYAISAMRYMEDHGIFAMEVEEAQELAWKDMADKILAVSPVVAGGCQNYYQDSGGRNKALWPALHKTFEAEMAEFDADAYEVIARDNHRGSGAGAAAFCS